MAGETLGGTKTEKKVMVAIDESECSHYALEWLLKNLFESISAPSQLIIFNAQPLNNFGSIYAASLGSARTSSALLSTSPELIQSTQEYQKKVSFALLERAKEICAKAGVTAETITEVGDPKEVICGAVEKYNINLLILGNHGRGVLKRAFVGSVSNYCVHNAKCPVLVVKKPM
ncbi:universal stress protein A-like protein isoform X1 [Tasmannia lanceolata]|uniref:universal stress protein A-like protein isoform X1 n=1 Tax=Tasmannia lanceolata TaxID=3420 RepID=UPI004062851B